MGERSQVKFESTGVHLYTHWGGRTLPRVVQNALAREARWNDPGYLARIVFDEMTGDDDGTTGFGIDDHQHGDVHRIVKIDCREGTVELENASFYFDDYKGELVTHDKAVDVYTFEEYVNADDPSWPEPENPPHWG